MTWRGRSTSAKASAARTPVQCTGLPLDACSSNTATSNPRRARRVAACRPPGPPPTMATSLIRNADTHRRDGVAQSLTQPPRSDKARRIAPESPASHSDLAGADLPLPAERNPERQCDQPQIEPEALAADVHPVVPELVATRDVARRVDLCDAGEPRSYAAPFGIARHLCECLEAAVAERLDLTGSQGAWSDEAHVADEDVPELRQFVHRRGGDHPSTPSHTA